MSTSRLNRVKRHNSKGARGDQLLVRQPVELDQGARKGKPARHRAGGAERSSDLASKSLPRDPQEALGTSWHW